MKLQLRTLTTLMWLSLAALHAAPAPDSAPLAGVNLETSGTPSTAVGSGTYRFESPMFSTQDKTMRQ